VSDTVTTQQIEPAKLPQNSFKKAFPVAQTSKTPVVQTHASFIELKSSVERATESS
jgi:hypothetical protein